MIDRDGPVATIRLESGQDPDNTLSPGHGAVVHVTEDRHVGVISTASLRLDGDLDGDARVGFGDFARLAAGANGPVSPKDAAAIKAAFGAEVVSVRTFAGPQAPTRDVLDLTGAAWSAPTLVAPLDAEGYATMELAVPQEHSAVAVYLAHVRFGAQEAVAEAGLSQALGVPVVLDPALLAGVLAARLIGSPRRRPHVWSRRMRFSSRR